jgi:hypothetical protein
MNRETWYILEDGAAGDPREIAPDADGRLRHTDGRAVAYAPHGPRSRGVDADAERAKAAPPKAAAAKPAAKPKAGATARDMKAESPAGGYQTRESKAD